MSTRLKIFTISLMSAFLLSAIIYILSVLPSAAEATAIEIYHIQSRMNEAHLEAEALRAEYSELETQLNILNTELYPF